MDQRIAWTPKPQAQISWLRHYIIHQALTYLLRKVIQRDIWSVKIALELRDFNKVNSRSGAIATLHHSPLSWTPSQKFPSCHSLVGHYLSSNRCGMSARPCGVVKNGQNKFAVHPNCIRMPMSSRRLNCSQYLPKIGHVSLDHLSTLKAIAADLNSTTCYQVAQSEDSPLMKISRLLCLRLSIRPKGLKSYNPFLHWYPYYPMIRWNMEVFYSARPGRPQR